MSESEKQPDVLTKPFKPDDAQAEADEELSSYLALLESGKAQIPSVLTDAPPGTNLEGALELAAWRKHRERQRLQYKK